MIIDFTNCGYGQMALENSPLLSFDYSIAGQNDTKGNYYVIYRSCKTHTLYCVTAEASNSFYKCGRTLKDDEKQAEICGVLVRPMTYSEETAYNEDRLTANVDVWGNIEVNDTFDYDWYYENCI